MCCGFGCLVAVRVRVVGVWYESFAFDYGICCVVFIWLVVLFWPWGVMYGVCLVWVYVLCM